MAGRRRRAHSAALSPPKRQRKIGKRRAAPQAPEAEDMAIANLIAEQTYQPTSILNAPTIAEVYASRGSPTLQKAREDLDKLVLLSKLPKQTKHNSAAPEAGQLATKLAEKTTLESLFTGPRVRGRDFVGKLEIHTTNRISRWVFGAEMKKAYRWITSCHKDLFTRAEAQAIMGELEALLNSWPGTLDSVSYAKAPPKFMTNQSEAFLRAAAARVVPSARQIFKNPMLRLARPKSGHKRHMVQCDIPLFNEQHNLYIYTFDLGQHGSGEINVPKPPKISWAIGRWKAGVVTTCGTHINADGFDEHDSGLDAKKVATLTQTELQEMQLAEELARYIIVSLSNRVIKKNEVPGLIELIKATCANSADWAKTRRLFGITRRYDSIYTTFQPTVIAMSTVNGRLPRPTVHTWDNARILRAMDAVTNAWISHGDTKKAWRALIDACEAIENDITAGIPSPAQCSCPEDEEIRKSTVHHCGGCANVFGCHQLRWGPWNLRVCPTCFEKETVTTFSSTKSLISKSIERNFHAELKRQNSDKNSKTNVEALEQMTTELCKIENESGGWKCRYTNQIYPVPPQLPRNGNPLQPSADAAFPFVLTEDGSVRKHWPGNVVITTSSLNYGKHVFLPTNVGYIAWFVRRREKLTSSNTPPDHPKVLEKEVMMIDLSILCRKIRSKARLVMLAMRKKAKSQPVECLERFELEKRQWLNAKLAPFDGPWNQPKAFHLKPLGPKVVFWKPEERERIRQFASLLEVEFGVKLLRGHDDCPWFGTVAPEVAWDWEVTAYVFVDRHVRLKYGCNRWDRCYDTPCTLFIECLFQACVRLWKPSNKQPNVAYHWSDEQKAGFQARYAELLKLPMSACTHDALAFSLGHRLHGFGMATGWILEPESLADRHDNRNNLLMETKFSNMLKNNYQGFFYQDLVDMVKNVYMGPDFAAGKLDQLPDTKEKFEAFVGPFDPDEVNNFEEEMAESGRCAPFENDDIEMEYEDEEMDEEFMFLADEDDELEAEHGDDQEEKDDEEEDEHIEDTDDDEEEPFEGFDSDGDDEGHLSSQEVGFEGEDNDESGGSDPEDWDSDQRIAYCHSLLDEVEDTFTHLPDLQSKRTPARTRQTMKNAAENGDVGLFKKAYDEFQRFVGRA